ncbi:S1 RNA-binding domain-containing protein [Lactobacillus sp. ESL0701]|uniref:S1 RNA-binding domain-containing protein n=1 Tax=Lactobacillus sp. ESL0701 TaxID=2983217 RepID=UPI0023F68C77|nr:S1 RNA-binding domain-containing protein [Lactobacillus sp. ESL0701]MDF7672598.1 S1 RNA-binding domain-containing protein [Lactobacillus sp. ESL0701]
MKYQVGQRITGVVNNITDLGIFISLPKSHSGLIHHSDFGNNWDRERHNYQIGQSVRTVIVHNFKGKISLSKMRVNDPTLVDQTNQFSAVEKADFLQVLTKTVTDSEAEIKKLHQELTNYGN